MQSIAIDHLHPVLAFAFGVAVTKFAQEHPDAPTPVLTCTYRSPAEQTKLYNQPTDKIDNNGNGKVDEPGERVTNAKAGESPHNYLPSLAFDVAFLTKDRKTDWSVKWFDLFAPYMLAARPGITWGGNFKSLIDRPHFELSEWRTYAGLTKKYSWEVGK